MNKQMKNTLIKVLIFFVLLVGAYCLWCHFLTDNVIWTKLKVNGIAIQGMTEEEAIIAITEDFQKNYQDKQMTVTLNGQEFQVSIYPALSIDAKARCGKCLFPWTWFLDYSRN